MDQLPDEAAKIAAECFLIRLGIPVALVENPKLPESRYLRLKLVMRNLPPPQFGSW